MNNPNAIANLTPFRRGFSPNRRSCNVERALRMARKLSPAGIAYCDSVLNDANEHVRYRLKAAEIILAAGLPKGADAISKFLGDDTRGTAFIEVRFVKPDEVIEHEAKPNGQHPGTFSVSFDAE